jgi:protein-tyrosine phosphatase
MTPRAADRFLPVGGAGNLRDLGDLPAAGRRTRRGLILRSDFLVDLGAEDERQLLREYGLRTVIDLRTAREICRFPGPWGEREVDLVCASLPLDPAFHAQSRGEMIELYLSFLEPPGTAMTTAIETAIDPGRHPLLIHCAAGKDRTGVLAALLLDLAGVEREAIVADYVLTHARMDAVLARLAAELGRRRAELSPAMHSAEAETIELFLAGLDERFGGASGWAREQGIAASRIEAFRETILTADPASETTRKEGS